jgi:restriction endonuclease S subunit
MNGYVINQIKNEYGRDVFTPLLIKNLYHFLQDRFIFLNNNKYGSAIPHLDKKIFLDLEIPLIPIEDRLKFIY